MCSLDRVRTSTRLPTLLSIASISMACASGAPRPDGAASATARGPRVNWHGYSADDMPTEFFEKNAPLPVTYEVDVAVDAAFGFVWLDEGAFFDGEALYYDRAYALRRTVPETITDAPDRGMPVPDIVLHAKPSADNPRDPRKRLVAMSPDGKLLAGVNSAALSILVPSTTDVTEIPVFRGARIVSPRFSPDSKRLYFGEALARTTRLHAFAIDSRSDVVVAELAADAVLLDVRRVGATDGDELLVGGATVERLDVATKSVTSVDASDARFGSDGEIVTLIREGATGHVERRSATGEVLARSAELRAPSDLMVARDPRRVAYQELREDGTRNLALLTLDKLEPVAPPPVPDAVTSRVLSTSGDGRTWVLAAEGASSFTTLHVIDWTDGGSDRTVFPAGICAGDECVAPPSMNAARTEHFTAWDGVTRVLHYRFPSSCGSTTATCPVAIHAREAAAGNYDCEALAFDAAGFITVDAAVRIGPHADPARDLEDIAAFVRGGFGRGQSIGVYARGAVGAAVLDVLHRTPSAFDAAVVLDADRFAERDDTSRSPLLVLEPIHGAAPAGDAFQFVRSLTDRAVDTRLVYVPDEALEVYARGGYTKQMLSWFTRVLGPPLVR